MPIDQPEADAPDTTRRSFLARATVGGALVAAGSIAGPLVGASAAGAQTAAEAGSLDDSAFAALAAPLELATVQVYSAALAVEGLSSSVATKLQLFQTHHQTVADTLSGLYAGDDALVADPAVLARAEAVGADQAAVLATLIELEEQLAATHLAALADISDPVTAKITAQVLAVEGQHAVALGVLAEVDLTPLTPATVSPAAVISGGDAAATTTTTTGEAGN